MDMSPKKPTHSSKTIFIVFNFLVLICLLSGCEDFQKSNALPALQNYDVPPDTGDGWETAHISEVGLDAEQLMTMMDRIRNGVYPNIHSALIVKDNKLVLEEYFAGKSSFSDNDINFDRDTFHELHSVTKSFTSALIGIAIDREFIPGIDTKILELFPDYTDIFSNQQKKEIRLRHMLTMTTGLKWDEWTYPYTDDRNDHAKMNNSSDPVRFLLSLPMDTMPGLKYVYNSGVSISLGEIIPNVSEMNVGQFAEKYLFQPLGIENYYWGRYPNGTFQTGGGLFLRPRDMAKFGFLFLNGGRWKSIQIVPESWVQASTKNQISHLNITTKYGYQWWLRTIKVGNKSIDTISAEGRGGQFIILVPSLQIVSVFTGWNDNILHKQPVKLLEDYILPSAANAPSIGT